MGDVVFVGVDPGSRGAVACVGRGRVDVWNLPKLEREDFDAQGFRSILGSFWKERNDIRVIIEEQQGFPHAKVKDKFAFAFGVGRNAGILEGAFELFGFKTELVRPVVWKKALGLSGKSKAAHIEMAKVLYPNIEIANDGQADALLLIEYARQHLN